jgi:hypothetical protein
MTKAAKASQRVGPVAGGGRSTLNLYARDGETEGKSLARMLLDPLTRHASLSSSYGGLVFGGAVEASINDTVSLLGDELDKAARGDMTMASRILASQAISLDSMFTELAPIWASILTRWNATCGLRSKRSLRAVRRLRRLQSCTSRASRLCAMSTSTMAGRPSSPTSSTTTRGARFNGKSVEQCHATGAVG